MTEPVSEKETNQVMIWGELKIKLFKNWQKFYKVNLFDQRLNVYVVVFSRFLMGFPFDQDWMMRFERSVYKCGFVFEGFFGFSSWERDFFRLQNEKNNNILFSIFILLDHKRYNTKQKNKQNKSIHPAPTTRKRNIYIYI